MVTDYNYMNLDNSQYLTARFDVGGKRLGELQLMTYSSTLKEACTVRAKRFICRQLFAILTGKNSAIAYSCDLKMRPPQGKEFASYRGQLDAQGMFAADFPTDATSMTGTYIAEAYTGKDIFSGSKNIQVEEFMPDRIKVELELNKPSTKLKTQSKLTLQPVIISDHRRPIINMKQSYLSLKAFSSLKNILISILSNATVLVDYCRI
jgi:hypothetical protein